MTVRALRLADRPMVTRICAVPGRARPWPRAATQAASSAARRGRRRTASRSRLSSPHVQELERAEEADAADHERGGGGDDRPRPGSRSRWTVATPQASAASTTVATSTRARVSTMWRPSSRPSRRRIASSDDDHRDDVGDRPRERESLHAERRVEREREHDVDAVLEAVEQERRAACPASRRTRAA